MHIKEAALWTYLIKIGAVDPTLADNVKRVAKRMGVKPPTKKELADLFPKGWDAKNPSWQERLERSDWLKDRNAKRDFGFFSSTGGSRGASRGFRGIYERARSAGAGNIAKGALRKSWQVGIPVAAVGSSIGSVAKNYKLQKDLGEDLTDRQKRDLFKKSKGWKDYIIGSGLGALGGAALPALDFAISAGKGHRLSTLKGMSPLIGMSSLYGLALGSNIGGMRAADKIRAKAEEMGYIKPKKKKLLKAAADDSPSELPKHYLLKRLGLLGLGEGAVEGALSTYLTAKSKGVPFRRLSKHVKAKDVLRGGVGGSIGGVIGGLLTGGIADQLVHNYLKNNK